MQMQNNKKNFDAPIDASKIGQEDERLRLLQQIKSARSQAGLFARANEKYNTKRWEDAWAPYYRIATSSAVVGGVISFLIGWAGCTLIATALFGSLMGYTVDYCGRCGNAIVGSPSVLPTFRVVFLVSSPKEGSLMFGSFDLCKETQPLVLLSDFRCIYRCIEIFFVILHRHFG